MDQMTGQRSKVKTSMQAEVSILRCDLKSRLSLVYYTKNFQEGSWSWLNRKTFVKATKQMFYPSTTVSAPMLNLSHITVSPHFLLFPHHNCTRALSV